MVSKNGVFSKEAKNAAVWILGGKKRQYNIAVYMSSNSVAKVKIFFCWFFINNFFCLINHIIHSTKESCQQQHSNKNQIKWIGGNYNHSSSTNINMLQQIKKKIHISWRQASISMKSRSGSKGWDFSNSCSNSRV